MKPHSSPIDILKSAYAPCSFFGTCNEACWKPESGQISRGFIDATGRLEDVEVIMVFAEPRHPPDNEHHDTCSCVFRLMDAAMSHVRMCYETRTDVFHHNVRWSMSQLFPDLSFEEQLRHVWLTEGRLCSIDDEIGSTRDRTYATTHLRSQIEAFSNASVVAFGGKAKHCLKGLGVNYIGVHALAPPGANHRPVRPSWDAAIQRIKERR